MTTDTPSPTTPPTAADVEEAMRDVVDPELGVNVVDLGLVYGLDVDDSNVAIIDMTLTSAACPLTDVIEDQIAQSLEGLLGLVLYDVGQRAGRAGERHVEGDGAVVVDLLAVEQAEVDDVDPELGVDDVLHGLDDLVLGRDGLGPVGGGRGLEHGRGGGLVEGRLGGHVGHAVSSGFAVPTACAVASFQAIQPSSAHLTRAG